MSSKFVYDNFTIIVTFKTDFTLSMTASQNYAGDFFINEQVQLTKIKKDTVIAALSRKSQKNIKCEFNVIDIEPKKLIISFILSFDFLPIFSEQITLEQIVNKGNELNKAESAELMNEIEELATIVDSFSYKSLDFTSENSHTGAATYQILQKQLGKGSYFLQISGYFTCTCGGLEKNDLIFTINVAGQKSQNTVCMFSNTSTYGYPYSLRKQLEFTNDGLLSVSASNPKGISMSLYTNIVSIRPMLKIDSR